MDMVAHGFFNKIFCNAKPVGKFPDFSIAIGHGFVQIIHRDQMKDGPFVGTILMVLPTVVIGVLVIKGSGNAMPQLVSQFCPLVGFVRDPGRRLKGRLFPT